MAYHLLFIPGLGDNKVTVQEKLVRTWRYWGVESELIQMHWANSEPWDAKFDRLLHRIDELHGQGKQVALVGASAGATAVINAYAARKEHIVACVLIAGKVNRPNNIRTHYREENPSFVTSLNDCQDALESLDIGYRKRILSLYGWIDELVYRQDSQIEGAKNRMVPTIGHVVTIGFQLALGAPGFIRFIKQQHTTRK